MSDADQYEPYSAFYDYRATGLEGDLQFYLEEAQHAGPPVLELGCGTGRILIPVAEAGIEIVGLDISTAMLNIARAKLDRCDGEVRSRVRLVQGDMRDFSLGQRFNLVMIPYRAFLHLLTPEDQRQALECIREHLTDGGRLVLNIFDPRIETIAAYTGSMSGAMKRLSEFVHPETDNRHVVWDSRHYDLEAQIVHQLFMLQELDHVGRVVSTTHTPIYLRYLFRYEMQYLLELCGYKVEALYGDFKRGPFKPGGEQVWVASRQ
jgi:ubiquinone/menaquinone biosynthesis C-methylase UbiE